LGETRTVGSNNLKLVTATFADLTGTINVDIWAQHIPMIELHGVYSIAPAIIRVWAEKKKASTLVSSLITPITDETLAEIDTPVEENNESESASITIKVQNVFSVKTISTFLQCLNCGRRVVQATAAKVIHCDRCRYTMRSADCTKKMCAQLVFQSEDQQLHLTAFHDGLQALFQDDVNTLCENTIAETLLLQENLTLTYDPKALIILELQKV
jgi:ribosomal protein L37AE/L43A